jgi:hypothetical protein
VLTSDRDVVDAREAPHQHLEHREEADVGSQAQAAAEGVEQGQHARGNVGTDLASAEAAQRPGRVIRWQLQRAHPAQAFQPPVHLAASGRLHRFAALPHGIVGVLDLHRRQGRFEPGSAPRVGLEQVPQQHADRPGVGDCVMEDPRHHELGIVEAQQVEAMQRSGRKVEGALELPQEQAAGLVLARVRSQVAQIP